MDTDAENVQKPEMDHATIKGRATGMIKSPRTKKAVKTSAIFFSILLLWISALELSTADRYPVSAKISQTSQAESSSDRSRIDYGTLEKGDTVTRFINIENGGNHMTEIRIICIGDISGNIKMSANDFFLNPKEQKKVGITLDIQRDTQKNSLGGMIFVLKIPKLF